MSWLGGGGLGHHPAPRGRVTNLEALLRVVVGEPVWGRGGSAGPKRRLVAPECHVRTGPPRERGMVTVELAVGVLAASVLLAVMSGVLGVLILQDRCRDVAGLVAREVARGDELGERVARGTAPAGANIDVDRERGWVQVTVSVDRRWGRVGPVTLTGQATAPLEVGEPGR